MRRSNLGAGLLPVLWLAAGTGALAADPPPPILTVCEVMQNLQSYDGKIVVVVGRYSTTLEGTLLDAECGFKVKYGGTEFSTSISTTVSDSAPPPPLPAGFQWDKPLLQQKLQEIAKTTKPRVVSDRWVAFYGRLETQLPQKMHIVINGKVRDVSLDAFAHLGGSPARLIPRQGGELDLTAP